MCKQTIGLLATSQNSLLEIYFNLPFLCECAMYHPALLLLVCSSLLFSTYVFSQLDK